MSRKIDEDMAAVILLTFRSAKEKLKKGLDDGPEGPPVILTPAEATIIYRAFFSGD